MNSKPIRRRKYVLYWMQAAQRDRYNHALEYAIGQANETRMPLVVLFGITSRYPEANQRHYHFMLEGLQETQRALRRRGIQMVIWDKSPEVAAVELAGQASLVIVDGGQTRIQRRWRRDVARKIDCALFEVETNLIVPVTEASQKEDFSAGTFRPKIKRKLDRYLVPLKHRKPKRDSLSLRLPSLRIDSVSRTIAQLNVDSSVTKADGFRGGTAEAEKHLRAFLSRKLDHYSQLRNDPSTDYLSNMSPYLHFGQISPLYIALRVLRTNSPGKEAYLEELIVRRELSHNFVFYNADYDKFEGLPPWAKESLGLHGADKREYVYSLRQFEQARTHDPYWNAAQKEMVLTGKMHGYMRMYWGKKILEWSSSPQAGFKIALHLNNKYELDGRDPNAFAGVAWCYGKHDRAWGERPVFGKIRYMNANGLKRKFDPDEYVTKVELIEKTANEGPDNRSDKFHRKGPVQRASR